MLPGAVVHPIFMQSVSYQRRQAWRYSLCSQIRFSAPLPHRLWATHRRFSAATQGDDWSLGNAFWHQKTGTPSGPAGKAIVFEEKRSVLAAKRKG